MHMGYEERYRAAYAAGVRCATGREHGADAHCRAFLEHLPSRGRLADFGCGEGPMALVAAKLGYQAMAIDSAPSAIARALEANCHPNIEFLCADVCELHELAPDSFDVAIDIGCLHIIASDDAAARYLSHAYRLLRPGGSAYYQNLVPADDAQTWFPQETKLVESWRERLREARTKATVLRSYEVGGRTVEVEMPVIPSARRGLVQQVALLSRAGFVVESARVVTPGMNSPFEAILVAHKPE